MSHSVFCRLHNFIDDRLVCEYDHWIDSDLERFMISFYSFIFASFSGCSVTDQEE